MCGFVSLRDAYLCRCCVAAVRGSLCLMLFVPVVLLRELDCFFLTCRLFYFGQPEILSFVCCVLRGPVFRELGFRGPGHPGTYFYYFGPPELMDVRLCRLGF